MSKLHNTEFRNRTNRGAVASSALAICFVVAGAVAPAQAGCNFRAPANVTWSGNYGAQTSTQYGANNNGLVSVQPAANANLGSNSGYTFYGRYNAAGNTNAGQRTGLNTSTQRYVSSPGLQRNSGLGSSDIYRRIQLTPRIIETRRTGEDRFSRSIGHAVPQIKQAQVQHGYQSGGARPIQIRGVGGNNNLQYGRSLVQFNGQANLARQVERIDVVGYKPSPLSEVPALSFQRDRFPSNQRREVIIKVTPGRFEER